MHELVEFVRTNNIGGLRNRQVREAYYAVFNDVRHSVRAPLKDGSEFQWQFADHMLLIQLTLQESHELRVRFKLCFREHPCSRDAPWDLVFGFDEYVPGDKLNFDNRKKLMCGYFNFANLGQTHLSQAATWFTPMALRISTISEVEGEWSHLLGVFLRQLFFGPAGFATAGVPIVIDGTTYILYARLKVLISDGDGLRSALCWNGASSIKPCIRHWNVLKRDTDLSSRLDGYCEVSCHDPAQFKYSSEKLTQSVELVAAAHRRWKAGLASDGLYERIVKTEGFHYVEGGLPFDEELRDRLDLWSAVRIDWVHSAMQEGALTIECHAFIGSWEPLGHDYQSVERFFKLPWRFPKQFQRKGRELHRVFSRFRQNSDGVHDKLRANAAECLGMYALLRHYADSRVGHPPELVNERASFDAICEVIDLIQMAKKQLISTKAAGRSMQRKLKTWLQRHKIAYGTGKIKPKFHWMFDVAEQLMLDDLVHDQFIIERLHLLIKAIADRIDNLRSFESSVLAGALNSQIYNARQLKAECLMHKGEATVPFLPDAIISDDIEVCGMHVSVDDLVFRGDDLGKVLACAKEHDMFYVLVRLLRCVGRTGSASARWHATRTIAVWPATSVEQD